MTLILPKHLPAASSLAAEGAICLDRETAALRLGERPLEVLLINLMPDKPRTELQFARLLAASGQPVALSLAVPASHDVKGTPASHLRRFYRPWPDYIARSFDGVIVTGAPLGGPVPRAGYNPGLGAAFAAVDAGLGERQGPSGIPLATHLDQAARDFLAVWGSGAPWEGLAPAQRAGLARRIDLGVQAMASASGAAREEQFQRVLLELQRTFDHFDRQFAYVPVAKLMLAPDPEQTGLLEFLAGNLDIPVDFFHICGAADTRLRHPLVPESSHICAAGVVWERQTR